MVNGNILMLCVTEFQRFVWFCFEILLVCFAMEENSIMDSGFRRMSCSTPANPFKPWNSFTPATDSSLDSSVNVKSPRRRIHSTNPFASENQLDNSPADLFTPCRKFTKPVKNPSDYDGTQSLRDYLEHFGRCFVVNG